MNKPQQLLRFITQKHPVASSDSWPGSEMCAASAARVWHRAAIHNKRLVTTHCRINDNSSEHCYVHILLPSVSILCRLCLWLHGERLLLCHVDRGLPCACVMWLVSTVLLTCYFSDGVSRMMSRRRYRTTLLAATHRIIALQQRWSLAWYITSLRSCVVTCGVSFRAVSMFRLPMQ